MSEDAQEPSEQDAGGLAGPAQGFAAQPGGSAVRANAKPNAAVASASGTANAPAASAAAASAPAASSPAKSKLWTRDYVLGIAINLFLLLNYFPLITMTTDYAMELFGASAAVAGAAASVFILGAVVSRLGSGALLDKIGRKRMLVGGLVVDAVCSVFYFFVADLAALFVLRIAHGLAFGAASTAISTVATSIVPADRKGEGIGYYMLSVTMGAAIGPSLGIRMAQAGSYTLVFACSMVFICVALVLAIVLRVPAPTGTGGYVTLSGKPAQRPVRHGIARIIEPAAVPISAVACLVFFAYSSLLAYLSRFGQETGLEAATGWFFVIYALTMFVTRPFTGKLFDRRGAHVVMVPAFVSLGVGMAVLGTANSGLGVFAAAALCGFGVGTAQACGLTIAVQKTPIENIGLANSTYYALLDTGVGLGPMVLGLLIPYLGINGVYLAMTGVAAAALVLFLIISRKPKPKRA